MRERMILTVAGLMVLAGGLAVAQPRPWASKVPPGTDKKTDPLSGPKAIAQGQQTYTNTCYPCHGPTAQGDGPAAAMINPPPRPLLIDGKLSLPDGVAFWVVTNGIDNTGMASMKESLTENERWAVITYLHALGAGKAPPADPAALVTNTSGKTAQSGPKR